MKKAILGLLVLAMVSVSATAQLMGMDIDDSKVKIKLLKSGGEPKYQLKQNYPVGKYRMIMDMNIKQSVVSADGSAMPVPADMKMKFIMLLDVSDYDAEGIKSIGMSYEMVEIVTPMGSGKAVRGEKKAKEEKADADEEGDETDASSTQPGANMVQMQAEQLVAVEGIVVKINKAGKIVKIEGLENMPGGQGEMLSNVFKDLSMSQKYPPIGVGGSFNVTVDAELPMIGKMLMNTVATLTNVEKTDKGTMGTLKSELTMGTNAPKEADKADAKKADKDADADDADEDEDESEDAAAPKLDMQINAKGTFITKMNLDTGLALETDGTMNNDMTMQAGPNGQMKMHQVIQMKITTEVVK